jgi:hypothetical protein
VFGLCSLSIRDPSFLVLYCTNIPQSTACVAIYARVSLNTHTRAFTSLEKKEASGPEDILEHDRVFFINWFCGVVGYHFCLTHRRS